MDATAATQGFSVKHIIDGAAVVTAFASFLHYLPAITSVLSFIWLSIQMTRWFIRDAVPWIKAKL
jgi:hypothetical protein